MVVLLEKGNYLQNCKKRGLTRGACSDKSVYWKAMIRCQGHKYNLIKGFVYMETILCKGFSFSGVVSGLKKNGQKDLGLIYSEVPASVAGVFTRNRVQAAPVLVDRERIKKGLCRAVIVNSGSANCCTGDQGMKDAVSEARLAAYGLNISEDQVLVASTGVIGKPLALDKIEAVVPELVKSLSLAE